MPTRTQNFVITGMTCTNCAQTVQKALLKNDKVSEASVSLATERARVTLDAQISDAEIEGLVKKAGYGAIVDNEAHQLKIIEDRKKQENQQIALFILSVILTLPVFFAMLENFWQGHLFDLFRNPWLQVILATPVQFLAGARFYRGAYHALRGKTANMDVLVALGTSIAYFSSLILGIFMGVEKALNFETSMFIIVLVLLGKVLENRAKSKTTGAISSLMKERVREVQLVDGTTKALEELEVGDRLYVLAGQKVPLDIEIKKGTASFDLSNLTGESIPVIKSVGDEVFEGAINQDGQIEALVIHQASDSTTARMVAQMAEAQSSKPHIQQLADKISAVFVPFVLVIAFLAFLLTYVLSGDLLSATMHAVAVLVIACPCALGLATPMGIVSATGLSARNGLLVKDTDGYERASKIKQIFFDKTGTITTGRFQLAEFDGSDFELKLLAALEAGSTHPLAKTIKEAVKERKIEDYKLDLTAFKEQVGLGVSGEINGTHYYAGNEKYMSTIHVAVDETKDTVIYLAVAGRLLATATFNSELKADAVKSVAALKGRGIETIMLTGDNEVAAKKIQYQLHLDKVFFALSPEEKAQKITDNETTLMVGDGMNDALALSRASLGVAMATGSDLAIDAGDITVVSGRLYALVDFFEISKKTIRKIRQNYFWAFIYNLIGIPLAAIGLLNPMLAAFMMSISSISVILNSLLLSFSKIRK